MVNMIDKKGGVGSFIHENMKNVVEIEIDF